MRAPRIRTFVAAALAVASLSAGVMAAEGSTSIRLNTVGYLPASRKVAVIAAPCAQFAVVRADDGSQVFEAAVAGPIYNDDTDEILLIADFSGLTEPGDYRLNVPGVGLSAPFRVADDVYNGPFYTVTRAMYLWRCGTAVHGTHKGQVFSHEACHMQDAYLDFIIGEHIRIDGTKGWHDAGDYNKYVTNAGVTVGPMQRAWEDFGPQIQQIPLDIPESGRKTPDFLSELKWELEWLLTMQAPDGSVYHKLSTMDFGGFIMPEDETEPRYFTPWSTAATADFIALVAAAARHFEPYEPDFAARCLQAAQKSYAFLRAHPQNQMADLTGFRTGSYQIFDEESRIWAAAELWQTTGSADALRDFEARATAALSGRGGALASGGRATYGVLTYLWSERTGRDEELVARLSAGLVRAADEIVATRDGHGYARPFGWRYFWGCHGSVAGQTIVLRAAHRVSPNPEYIETALDALNHLFGRNYFGRSFVTGLGHLPPMHPHDRRSGGDDVEDPWPGYLIGGPHPGATDWQDVQEDYRTNEIAINWNGPLIYALAGFLDVPGR